MDVERIYSCPNCGTLNLNNLRAEDCPVCKLAAAIRLEAEIRRLHSKLNEDTIRPSNAPSS